MDWYNYLIIFSKKLYTTIHSPIGRLNNIIPVIIPAAMPGTEKLPDFINIDNPDMELTRKSMPVIRPGETFLSLIV